MNQAIKILEKYRSKIESEENRFRKEKNYEWADNNNAVKLLLQKIIDEISSLPSDTQWIDVNDKSPDWIVLAIWYQDEMLIWYCWDEYGDWTCEWDNIILEKVTHWMPLPIPPNN